MTQEDAMTPIARERLQFPAGTQSEPIAPLASGVNGGAGTGEVGS